MDQDWKVSLKQAGINSHQCINLHGIDASTLNSIDAEFYYHGDHETDPLGIGKEYGVEEIT
jgi:hypothetical protein